MVPVHVREIAVVVKKTFPADTLTLADLKEIYLGHKRILGRVRLTPLDQRGDQEINAVFLKRIMGLSRSQYLDHWLKLLYREGGRPPFIKKNSEDVLSTVEEITGAIGYVWSDEAKAAGNRVKILITIEVNP